MGPFLTVWEIYPAAPPVAEYPDWRWSASLNRKKKKSKKIVGLKDVASTRTEVVWKTIFLREFLFLHENAVILHQDRNIQIPADADKKTVNLSTNIETDV